MRCFLSITNIDKMDIYMLGKYEHLIWLKIYLISLIQLYFFFYFPISYLNIYKNIFDIKKLAVSLLITPNKIIIH